MGGGVSAHYDGPGEASMGSDWEKDTFRVFEMNN